MAPPQEEGVVATPDGERLQYRCDGHGPSLQLVHGLASSLFHWPFFIERFRHGYRVVSWDYRGHGGAPPPRDPATVTVEQFAADSHTVTRAVAPGGVALVGLSFGVQVALEHYRRCPADVRALVLICGTYGHPLDRIARAAALRRGAAAFVRGFCRLGPAARVALGVVRTPVARELTYLSGGARRELCPRQSLDELFGHVARLEPRVFGEICAAYFEHSALDVLPTIRVPTLIIAGDRDQLTPVSIAERMQAQIPGARLRVFPGHSHLVQLERPEAVHAAVADFLAGAGLVPAD